MGDDTQVLNFLVQLPNLSLFLVLRQPNSLVTVVRDLERPLDSLSLGGDGGVLV